MKPNEKNLKEEQKQNQASNPLELAPLDLTTYLQLEGRRRAAELAAHAGRSTSSPARPPSTSTAAEGRPPQSLSEFLHRMGLAPPPRQQAVRVRPQRPL